MSVTTAVPSRLKASEGRRIAPTKSALSARYSRMAAFCLSSVKCVVTRRQHAAGLEGVDGLGEEVVVQSELVPAIVELQVGEGHVADHRINAVFGQAGIAEVLDADVLVGVQRFGDTTRNAVQFHADETHSVRPLTHKVADAAAGFEDGCISGNSEAGDTRMDGRDDGRGRVEGVEGGAFGAIVFLRREQRLQFLAESLPAGILVAAGDRIGEDRQGDWPEPREAGEDVLLLRGGRSLLGLDPLDSADGGENVAGLGFFAAGDGRRGGRPGPFRGGSVPVGRLGGMERRGFRWGSRLRRFRCFWWLRGGEDRIGLRKGIEERGLTPCRLYAGGV